MEYNKSIKDLIGTESLLLIFPKEVGNLLNIAHQELLTFEVRNSVIVIKKVENQGYNTR